MGIKTLLDFADSGTEIPATTVVVSRKYSKANRDVVLRFLKAYVEGTHRLLTDRGMGIGALSRYGGIEDKELLASTHEFFTSRYIKKVPTPTLRGVERSLNLIAETNSKARERRAEGGEPQARGGAERS